MYQAIHISTMSYICSDYGRHRFTSLNYDFTKFQCLNKLVKVAREEFRGYNFSILKDGKKIGTLVSGIYTKVKVAKAVNPF